MHLKNVKTALALAALAAVTLAEPASAWQDANEIIATIPAGIGLAVYVDPLRGKVYTGTTVIDGKTDTVTKTLLLPAGYSILAGDPLHGKAYAATYANSPDILIIDEDTDTVIASIPTDPAPYLLYQQVVVDPLHEKVFYGTETGNGTPNSAGNSYVVVIDQRTNTITSKLAVPGDVRGLAVDPVRETIYAFLTDYEANGLEGPHSIVALDERTGKIKTTIPMVDLAQGLAIDVEKGLLYAPGTGYSTETDDFNEQTPGWVVVIDEKTNKVIDTVVVAPLNPNSSDVITEEVAVAPLSNTVYATNFAVHTVAVIDQLTNKIISTITTPGGNFGVGVDPIRRKVYVGCLGTGVLVISAPGWSEIAFGSH
jgi:DNA-binding beta-propeller fold protein YncE